ncbi:hypothetical protein [Alkalimarinus alittae]|uniref:Uncharacterized protein n=1 Tax=Alkalimarinus alittae TaxID=2961619 RepID=A0ABY6N498_9ALTE|nr:hypothetical protein [Alkalimarinus alittae]UZE96916.1 hypothetical protein NKI27_03965 [Alkalimarinus alittae]
MTQPIMNNLHLIKSTEERKTFIDIAHEFSNQTCEIPKKTFEEGFAKAAGFRSVSEMEAQYAFVIDTEVAYIKFQDYFENDKNIKLPENSLFEVARKIGSFFPIVPSEDSSVYLYIFWQNGVLSSPYIKDQRDNLIYHPNTATGYKVPGILTKESYTALGQKLTHVVIQAQTEVLETGRVSDASREQAKTIINSHDYPKSLDRSYYLFSKKFDLSEITLPNVIDVKVIWNLVGLMLIDLPNASPLALFQYVLGEKYILNNELGSPKKAVH